MLKKPKISIITVAFNSAKTIKGTIESIISQDYNNIEYLIIDGGSTDGTMDIVKSYSEHVKYYVSEPDNGIYDAMNKGIKAATGDVIGILNSDDFYPNSFVLSNVAKLFQKYSCDAVYGDLVYVKANDINKIKRYWQAGEYSTSKIKNGWMLPHPTFFVKKKIYTRYGLYDTDLKSAADYEMILKLLYKHNISVHYLPMILVNMRMGGESNKSFWNRIKANKEDSLAWTKNQLNKPMFVRLKKPLQKLRQFFLKPEI
ncbi:MAG: glycosyltransferase family 2 protein [Bacteroidetes bacterium]|nr:glycosyltransferase [Pelagibacterales bacterium]MDA0682256.1 glycosyltransferase family 2 protein [Bacteroidota bacterium]MDA1009178.1 glycosyltransferase family 2 protein [Bacteroidota bacterium]